MKWDPEKYVQFGDYRDRPFFDLTGRIHAEAPRHVVDLGCGPGNLTATLADRWPGAQVVGLDSSPEMLAISKDHAAAAANLSYDLADIEHWLPSGDTDVVVTNAALQWVPGHRKLLPGWLDALKPGAWFALQVPGNFNAPSHTLMRELAESPAWAGRLAGVLRHDAWETTYQQLLPGAHPVLEWVRGTGLRPVLAALPEDEAREFEAEYSARLDDAYPAGRHGTVFPFRRTFAVAQKTG